MSATMKMLNQASQQLKSSKTITLEVLDIHPNPLNRAPIEDIDQIKESITERGMMIPIVVYKVSNNNFRLLAGERRWTAHKELGMEYIQANVVEKPENEDIERFMILTMNSQRDFTEEYKASRIAEYGELYSSLGIKGIRKTEWISQHVGFEVSARTVQDYLTGDRAEESKEKEPLDIQKEINKRIKQLEKAYEWLADRQDEISKEDIEILNRWGTAFKEMYYIEFDELEDTEGDPFRQIKIN